MARELHYKDLCEILSTKCCVSETTIERMIENFILLIASELQNNSYIRIKNIGKFSVEQRGGADEWIQDGFGKMRKRYVEPFKYVDFEPSQNLLDVINGESLNYLFRKVKLKYDKPTAFEDVVSDNMETDITDEVSKIISHRKTKQERTKERKEKGITDPRYTTNLKEYNQRTQRPLLCKNNNIIYPSVNSASIDLGIPYQTLKNHVFGENADFKVKGYEFEIVIKEEQGEKDNGKV